MMRLQFTKTLNCVDFCAYTLDTFYMCLILTNVIALHVLYHLIQFDSNSQAFQFDIQTGLNMSLTPYLTALRWHVLSVIYFKIYNNRQIYRAVRIHV
jgi:hypothetical protein